MNVVDLYAWAWRQKIKPTRKILLLYLVKMSDKNTFCFPSTRKISESTGINIKTVTLVVRDLEESGLIYVKRTWGNKSEYHLLIDTKNCTTPQNCTTPKNGVSTTPKNGVSQYNYTDADTDTGHQLSDAKKESSKKEVSPAKQLVADYLNYCPSGKSISFQFAEGHQKIKEKISYVVKNFSRDEWVRAFRLAEESDWVSGKIPSSTDNQYFRGMSLGWILTPKIMEAILSGRYANRKPEGGPEQKDNFDIWLEQQNAVEGEVIHD